MSKILLAYSHLASPEKNRWPFSYEGKLGLLLAILHRAAEANPGVDQAVFSIQAGYRVTPFEDALAKRIADLAPRSQVVCYTNPGHQLGATLCLRQSILYAWDNGYDFLVHTGDDCWNRRNGYAERCAQLLDRHHGDYLAGQWGPGDNPGDQVGTQVCACRSATVGPALANSPPMTSLFLEHYIWRVLCQHHLRWVRLPNCDDCLGWIHIPHEFTACEDPDGVTIPVFPAEPPQLPADARPFVMPAGLPEPKEPRRGRAAPCDLEG